MGRTSRRSARAASLAPGSPPPEDGVRPSDGAWEAAALVDGELRLLGRYATEAEAWEAHEAATATQSGAGSPRASGGPRARKAAAHKSPARRTAVAPAHRVTAAPSLSPPPRAPKLAPPPRARRRRLPLLTALLVFALAAAAAALWASRAAARHRKLAPGAAALAAPRCAASADAPALAALAAEGPAWREWAAATAEELAAPRAASALSQQKADVVLLAMPLGPDGGAAFPADAASAVDAAADEAFPACAAARCRLSLRLGGGGGVRSRGALQAALVPFLRRCPGGLVVVHDVAHPQAGPALPALLPLLSEGGQYEADGRAVTAVRAAVLLTARLRGVPDEGGEEAYRRAAKGALAAALAAAGGGGDGAGDVARALRRRVDAVAPLRQALRGEPGFLGDATL